VKQFANGIEVLAKMGDGTEKKYTVELAAPHTISLKDIVNLPSISDEDKKLITKALEK
jgi:hypothetical protein